MMVNVPDSVPERLYLLAYDTRKQRMTVSSELGYLMRAGILAELLIQGHITDATRGPAATTGKVADPLLDDVLQQIATSRRRRSWQYWVGKSARQSVIKVRDRLESDGWIRVEHRRVLGIFPMARVTVRDTRVVKELVATVSSAVRGSVPGSRLEPRDAGLAALASVVKLKTVLPRAGWREGRRRSEELGQVVAPVPRALRKTIQAAYASAAAAAG